MNSATSCASKLSTIVSFVRFWNIRALSGAQLLLLQLLDLSRFNISSRDMPYAYFPGSIAIIFFRMLRGLLNLEPLSVRRRNAQCSFIAGLLNDSIESSPLLHRVDIYAPSRTLRSRETLRLAQPRSIADRSDPMFRMSAIFNTVSDCFSFNISSASRNVSGFCRGRSELRYQSWFWYVFLCTVTHLN